MSVAYRQHINRLPIQQKGQAMVFVMLMLGIVLMSLTFMYKSGKLTSEKMELQNAADSSAYSFSLIEARDLNFQSYLNRAMVANEVAIGQAVGLLSWASYLASIGFHLDGLARVFNSVPIVGNIIAGAITAVATGFKAATGWLPGVVKTIGNFVIKAVNGFNLGYSVAGTSFHIASIYLGINTLIDMIDANDPDAKLSAAGGMTLVMHLATYHGIFSKRQKAAFTVTNDPTQTPKKGRNDYAIFLSLVQDARDRFSKSRSWRFALPIIPPTTIPLDIPVIGNIGEFFISLAFNIDRSGGSELRFKKQAASTTSSGSGHRRPRGVRVKGNAVSWTAADVLEANVEFMSRLRLLFGSGTLGLSNGAIRAQLCATILGAEICVPKRPFSIPFPNSISFGTGASQAASPGFYVNGTDMNPEYLPIGTAPNEAYGGAAGHGLTWLGLPFAPTRAVPLTISRPANQLSGYKGLPKYVDTNTTITNGQVEKPGEYEGFAAPYFIVGVIKEEGDIPDTVNPSGSLSLERKLADGEMGAIAKSELYFFRPNDSLASYFRRDDRATEYDNAFNPYWQARLVDTNHVDRMGMLLIQQKQFWLANLAEPAFGIGNGVLQLVDTILGIF